jgi:aromatic-amino-acid transaminase
LHHAVTNFLEPGQALLTTSFYWGPYQTIAQETRRAVETFEMFESSGRFHVEAYEAALVRQMERQGRALVFLNSPCHNPTGFSLDDQEWSAVADVTRRAAEKGPLAFLIDFAYARFGSRAAQGFLRHVGRIADPARRARRLERIQELRPVRLARRRADRDAPRPRRAARASPTPGLLLPRDLVELQPPGPLGDHRPALRSRRTAHARDQERARLIALLDERVQRFNREAAAARLRYPRYEGGFFVSVFSPDAEGHAAQHEGGGRVRRAAQGAPCAWPCARRPCATCRAW